MKSKLTITGITLALGVLTANMAQATTRTATTGTWESASTWTPSGAPTCGDVLIIPAGVTVLVTAVNTYYPGGCNTPGMVLDIYGTLEFQNGKKLAFPCNSVVTVFGPSGLIDPGTGGGNSNNIQICAITVWQASDGPVGPGECFPQPDCQVILAVKMLEFTAEPVGAGVRLVWVAISSDQTVFEAQRSINGVDFQPIGSTTSAGSGITETFSIYDPTPHIGVSVYRIEATEPNGHTWYSPILSVSHDGPQVLAISHATGVDGYHSVDVTTSADIPVEVAVIGTLGQLIVSTQETSDGNGHVSIQLPIDLAAGYYFAVARTTTGVASLPLVIQ